MHPVLIVDDEKDNLQALQRLLRNHFTVTAVTSPREALELSARQEFHVIVSDQRMPEMTGVELLERVMKVSPMTTRILLTGYTDIESVISAINRGNIYRYVAKPWDPEELRLTLRQADESYLLRREIAEKNIALETKNRELKTAVENLKVLDSAKRRFLSLVSHELNTPLTVLTSFVSLLHDNRPAVPPTLHKAIDSLSGATNRLEEIIVEVIEFVRLESDPVADSGSFDWDKELVAAISGLDALRSSKQIECLVEGGAPVKLQCDAAKLRLALRHLLADTFRRAPANSRVHLQRSLTEKELVLQLHREGEPLSPHALEALDFQGNAMNHTRDLGLRLALVRRVAEQHGGTLTLPERGQGRVLELRLPR